MAKDPVLLVDDDLDDLGLIKEVTERLAIDRPIYYFRSGDELINHLKETPDTPFLIICDVNLPGETGFDIKRSILENPELKYKSVPFIFWSTDASEKQIQRAYDLPAQGFFFKPSEFNELCDTLDIILKYWSKSQHPKRVK